MINNKGARSIQVSQGMKLLFGAPRRFERVKFQNWNSVSDEILLENLFATLAFRVAHVNQWEWQQITLVIRQQMKGLHVTRPV